MTARAAISVAVDYAVTVAIHIHAAASVVIAKMKGRPR